MLPMLMTWLTRSFSRTTAFRALWSSSQLRTVRGLPDQAPMLDLGARLVLA